MDKTLRTWRLTPSKDSDLWSQSTYRGEVWVRAHDAIEARKLCAQRFRVRPDRRRARMESPWYVRQLSGCELDEGAQFDCVQIPCVVSPVPDGKCLPEATRATAQNRKVAPEVVRESGRKRHVLDSQPAPHEVVALDIRQAIVALLVAREIDLRGRWLDVYATRAIDEDVVYVIIPAARLKPVISECLAPLIDRKLADQETKWILSSADAEKLLGSDNAKLQAA